MLDLVFTIISSTAIAIILKINSNKKGSSLVLLSGNYLSASVIGLILFFADQNSSSSAELVPLGILLAILFVGSIFAFSKSVSLSGAAISTVSSRLSVLVPIILSMLIYKEYPNVFQIIGLLLTIITIILFYLSLNNNTNKTESKNKFIYLVAILIGIGVADFFMKIFRENWTATDKPLFLFWIFFFSFLITSSLMLKQKNKIDYKY